MTDKQTGGPAFPLHNHGAQTLGLHLSGMTLRDYFAAKVLAMLMHPDAKDYNPEETARRAYLFADAMLKAREAGNG